MADDPEPAEPAAPEVRLVPPCPVSRPDRYEQREAARRDVAALHARAALGDPATGRVVHRFLDAWREYLRLSLAGLGEDLQAVRGEPVGPGTGNVVRQWAALSEVVVELWPDTAGEAATAAWALIRLQTAFGSRRVDVRTLHPELLAVAELVDGLEARAGAQLEFLRELGDG